MEKNRFELFRKENGLSAKRTNNGFTLVELIVVLVILAILAAILVPALLGYIDRAREKQDILHARNCMEATQACFVEEYAKDLPYKDNKNVVGIPANKVTGYGDVEAVDSAFAKRVLQLADENPYIFLVATGNCNKSNVSKRDMYTVYYACYVKEKGSVPFYYYNGNWSKQNPTNVDIVHKDQSNKTNELISPDGKHIPIQYYIISNTGKLSYNSLDSGTFWGYLRTDLDNKWNK